MSRALKPATPRNVPSVTLNSKSDIKTKRVKNFFNSWHFLGRATVPDLILFPYLNFRGMPIKQNTLCGRGIVDALFSFSHLSFSIASLKIGGYLLPNALTISLGPFKI